MSTKFVRNFNIIRSTLSMRDSTFYDFSVTKWQSANSAQFLLILRTMLFLIELYIVFVSLIATPSTIFLIYLTYWGLLLVLITTGLSVVISVRAVLFGIPDSSQELPWYVKVYWALFNATVPIAFLITLFYWAYFCFFYEMTDCIPRKGLIIDVGVHGFNSIVMLIQLMVVAHPYKLEHLHQPIAFGIVYTAFTLIYHVFGGVDPCGNHFIYPVYDWSKPIESIVMIIITAVIIVILHMAAVKIAAVKNYTPRCFQTNEDTPQSIMELPTTYKATENDIKLIGRNNKKIIEIV